MGAGKRIAKKDFDPRQKMIYQCFFIEMYEAYVALRGSNSGISEFYDMLLGEKFSNPNQKFGEIKNRGDISNLPAVVNCLRNNLYLSDGFEDFKEHLLYVEGAGVKTNVDLVKIEEYAQLLSTKVQGDDFNKKESEVQRQIHDYVREVNDILTSKSAGYNKVYRTDLARVIEAIMTLPTSMAIHADNLAEQINSIYEKYEHSKQFLIKGINQRGVQEEAFVKLFSMNEKLKDMSDELDTFKRYYEVKNGKKLQINKKNT